METKKAIEILEKHQAWRRDIDDVTGINMQDPIELGQAIDYAIKSLKDNLISLRDKFAMQAIGGFTSAVNDDGEWTSFNCENQISEMSYKIADAMLKERQKTN